MQPFAKDIFRRLTEASVEFVVVGGVSAVLLGAPIVTQDLDLCYRRTPDNLTKLATALQPLAPRARGFPPDLPFVFDATTLQLGCNFTLEVGTEMLDLLGEMSGIGNYEQIIAQTEEVELDGMRLKVLSLPQLIRTKEAANRPKDHAVLPILRATLELRQKGNA
jgi:predicted nucleotidyltransferase